MKFNSTLTDIIKVDLEIGAVPALFGEPGIGKSSFVEALATSMATQAFTLPCNQLADKADLTGARLVPYTKSDGTESYKQVFYPHDVVQAAIDYAKDNPREWPILFFDEMNRTTSDVTSAVLTMITLRRLGREDLPKNLRIMVAGNDKGNVVALDDASISRFAVYRVEPDAQTLIEILGDAINPHVRTVLTRFPDLVFEKPAPGIAAIDGNDDDDDQATTVAALLDSGEEMYQITTPRTIEGISKWLNVVGQDQQLIQTYLATTVETFDGREISQLAEIVESHIGGTEFASHLVAEIASAINSGGGTATGARIVAARPNVYASLKQTTTVTDLDDLITSLTPHERSASLLYALHESQDNRVLIQQLSAQVPQLEADHNSQLVNLAANGALDDGNVAAFRATGAPVAAVAGSLLDALMG